MAPVREDEDGNIWIDGLRLEAAHLRALLQHLRERGWITWLRGLPERTGAAGPAERPREVVVTVGRLRCVELP